MGGGILVGGDILRRIATSPGRCPPVADGRSVTGLFDVRIRMERSLLLRERRMPSRAVSEFR